MKYLFITLCLFCIGSCKSDLHERDDYIDVSVIRDRTDPHILKPEANSILSLFNLSADKSAGVNFRYHEISDKVLVPVINLQLPDESVTKRQNRKNEPMFREKIILNFYDTIRKTLSYPDMNNDSSFLDHSECFKTISGELSILSQSNRTNRVLLIFSNLFENSTIANIYAGKTKNLLLQNPVKLVEQFNKAHLLPETLIGIKVFFIFQPASREEDLLYLKMADIYKRLLELRGAIVKVQADNNFLK